MSAPTTLPPHASLLFDGTELAIYQEWRVLYAPTSDYSFHIPLPSASELAEYTAWRTSAYSGSTDFPDVPAHSDTDGLYAEKCHHPLHPQTAIPIPAYCPLCTLGQHSALLAALYGAWEELGAPFRHFAFEDHATRQKYSDVLRTYQAARVVSLKALGRLKEEAARQGEGDAEAEPWRKFGAATAVAKYREQEAQAVGPEEQIIESRTPKTPKAKKGKTISYDATTPEDTRHTPQALWSRGIPTRDAASPHACPDPEGWEDTSYCNDWEYNLSQCRILLCFYPDDESETLQYRDLNAGEDRGLDNPHVRRLIDLIKAKVAMQTEGIQANWYRYLPGQSDIWQVWSPGMEDNEEFTLFDQTRELVGSHVEEWAWKIGEIEDDEDEYTQQEGGWQTEGSEDEEDDEDYDDAMSLNEEEEDELGSDVDLDGEVERAELVDIVLVDPADLKDEE